MVGLYEFYLRFVKADIVRKRRVSGVIRKIIPIVVAFIDDKNEVVIPAFEPPALDVADPVVVNDPAANVFFGEGFKVDHFSQ